MLISIEELNNATESQFISTINLLFEPAPPLVKELLNKRPLTSYRQLISLAQTLIQQMSLKDQIDVINAHPRIGQTKSLSALSAQEQGSQTTPEVLQRLAVLNQEYESKFGFKFVVFVNGRSRAEIVTVLKERMSRSREEELETGLNDMISIAYNRLSKLE